MKVRKIDGKEVFKDGNKGYIFGLEETSTDFPGYVEWFRSEKARDECIKENNMVEG